MFSIYSFVRGYHVYTDIWTPNVGYENLYLEPEDGNEYGKNAVVVIIDGKTGGNIPKNLSKTFKHFLTLPNCTIKCIYCNRKTCESWYWLRTQNSCQF